MALIIANLTEIEKIIHFHEGNKPCCALSFLYFLNSYGFGRELKCNLHFRYAKIIHKIEFSKSCLMFLDKTPEMVIKCSYYSVTILMLFMISPSYM